MRRVPVFAVFKCRVFCRRGISYLDVNTRAVYRGQNCRTSKEGYFNEFRVNFSFSKRPEREGG